MGFTPTCEPSGATRRTSVARISSFTRRFAIQISFFSVSPVACLRPLRMGNTAARLLDLPHVEHDPSRGPPTGDHFTAAHSAGPRMAPGQSLRWPGGKQPASSSSLLQFNIIGDGKRYWSVFCQAPAISSDRPDPSDGLASTPWSAGRTGCDDSPRQPGEPSPLSSRRSDGCRRSWRGYWSAGGPRQS